MKLSLFTADSGEALLVAVEVGCWKGFETLSAEIEQDVQLQPNTVTARFV